MDTVAEINKKKILVVDDNPVFVELIADFLADEGYAIHKAFDGEEGLNKARELLPDLILLDVMMPKLDGFGVCEKLKKEDNTKLIPIIIITGKFGTDEVERGFNLGAIDCLTKPPNWEDLMKRISRALKK